MTDSVSTAAVPSGDGLHLNVGRVFLRTYGTFRLAPWRLMAIEFIVLAVTAAQIVSRRWLSPRGTDDDALLLPLVLVAFAVLVLRLVVQVITQNALIHAAARLLAGETARIGEALRVGTRRFFPALGVLILAGLAIVAGLLLLVIPGIVLALALSLALPACVLERCGPIESMKRSFYLTRDNRWRILAAGLVTFLALLGVTILTSVVIVLLVTASDRMVGPEVRAVVVVFLTAVLLLVWGVTTRVFAAVLFAELRRLKDGIAAADALVGVFS